MWEREAEEQRGEKRMGDEQKDDGEVGSARVVARSTSSERRRRVLVQRFRRGEGL